MTVDKRKINLADNSTDIPNIEKGMTVIHNRFGKGTVIKIKGDNPNTKALIQFDVSGEKQLLLKFAKLKIIHSN